MQDVIIIAVIFIATLIRSTIGFGDALIAVPIISLFVGLRTATALSALTSFVVAIMVSVIQWRTMAIRAILPFIGAALVGIPVGVLLLRNVPSRITLGILGVFLVIFGLYRLFNPKVPETNNPLWTYLLGFLGGILGAAYNTHGPLVALYGTLRRWSPETYRSTLQGYFLVTLVFILLGHFLGGLWTLQLGRLFLISLPVVVIATLLGGWLNKRIPVKQFERIVHIALVALGVLLIIR
jgi:uncharacterized protein